MTTAAASLLALLFLAHFLGDFTPLATRRMQEAKARGRPVGPIATHALLHAVLVGAAVMVMARPGVTLTAVAVGLEFGTHLGIDWLRGCLTTGRPSLSEPKTQAFWSILGIDQLAHGLILIGIAYLVL